MEEELRQRILKNAIDLYNIEKFLKEEKICDKCEGSGKTIEIVPKVLRYIRMFCGLISYEISAIFGILSSGSGINNIENGAYKPNPNILAKYIELIPMAKQVGKMHINGLAVGQVWISLRKTDKNAPYIEHIIVALTDKFVWFESIKNKEILRVKMENVLHPKKFEMKYDTPLGIRGYNC